MNQLTHGQAQQLGDLFQRVADELRHARTKFPKPEATGYALFEEVGELSQAILQYKFEGRATKEDIRAELVQTMTMLCRLWVDGDDSIGLEPVGSDM